MTDEELTAIRERAEKATAKVVRIPNAGNWLGETYEIGSQEGTMEYYYEHAREDIPKLLAEIERLKEIIDWNVSCVVCVNQLGEGWQYDENYGELICGECLDNRYGGDVG